MRPASSNAVGSVAASNPVVLDYRGSGPKYGVAVDITGTLTYSVQYTLDDVFAPGYVPGSGLWFNVPVAALVGATADQSGEITIPCTALRVNVTAWTSGTATLRVVPSNGPAA